MADNIPEIQIPPYDMKVALKKGAWAFAQYGVARTLAPAFLPQVVAMFDKITSVLKPIGIGISINQPVFEAVLPTLIFIFLVGVHDAAKVKFNQPWL